MLKLKIAFANLIWKMAGISPKMGNIVMDVLGYENYCKVARCQTIHKSRRS